jgi:hypothetical protein
MRLRGRKFEPRVTVQDGAWPIVMGFGWGTAESSVDEALAFASTILDAAEQARARKGNKGEPSGNVTHEGAR